MPVVGYEGQHPPIERARKSVEWLRGVYKRLFGKKLDLIKLTRNGEYPIVYLWQTYEPEGGDDGYGIAVFTVKPDGSIMSDEEFQREFSKNSYYLHFPSICEIDTRQPEGAETTSAPA